MHKKQGGNKYIFFGKMFVRYERKKIIRERKESTTNPNGNNAQQSQQPSSKFF